MAYRYRRWCVEQERIATEKLNNICEELCALKDERWVW